MYIDRVVLTDTIEGTACAAERSLNVGATIPDTLGTRRGPAGSGLKV